MYEIVDAGGYVMIVNKSNGKTWILCGDADKQHWEFVEYRPEPKKAKKVKK